MQRYAVLLVPEFRLQARLRHAPELRDQPAALLESHGTKSRVEELNPQARANQVERGMTPTQALARCAGLYLLHGNSGHERSARDILLQTAETLSPFLEITAPGVVTVELPGERSFTEEDFMRKWIAPLRAVGLDARAGVAATPFSALLAARRGRPVRLVAGAEAFLEPLEIEAIEPSEELRSVLHLWGIQTIGQFTALPKTQVGERLGPEALQLWDRAMGGSPRPLQRVAPREFFAEQADLENPLEMLEPLLFLLRRFLDQIALRLGQAYLVAGKIRLKLNFENGASYSQLFTIPQPTREVELLFRMLYTHLENFTAESPIIGLELAAQPVRPTAEQFSLLEKGRRDSHQFAETLARLQALLGADRVGSPELSPSHHPDAFQMRPYETGTTTGRQPTAELLLGVPWLRFRPPLPAQVVLNDFQPAFLSSSRASGPIHEVRGPWFLEGKWWEERPWAREEWDIATDRGLFRLVRIKERWFLDGIYA